MVWILLILQVCTAAGLAYYAWQTVLARRRAAAGAAGATTEEAAEAEAFLTHTIEQLLQDLQASADQATTQLLEQTGQLERLLSAADARLAQWPAVEARLAVGAAGPVPPASAAVTVWTARVAPLADEGLAPREIARRLARSETEIRLVLARTAGGRA